AVDDQVAVARLGAGHHPLIIRLPEAAPTPADPAHLPRRNADHQRVVRHVACDHRTGTHEGVTADHHPAHYGGVCAERATAPEHGALERPAPADGRAWVSHVGEHARWADEDVVFDHDPLEEGYVVLHLHAVADLDTSGNE